MATVDSICDALNTQFLAMADVDFASVDNFFPPVQTTSVAALTLPFSQQDTIEMVTHGNLLEFTHRIRTEFWVKHVQGSEAATMALARDIGRKAIMQLVSNDGTGYDIHRGVPFEYQVEQGMLDTSLPWLVCVLVTPIWNTECPT